MHPLSVLTLVSLLGLAASKTLVPLKYADGVLPRSSWKRELLPKNVVSLAYALPGEPHPSSSLTFTAHKNIPILLLEDLDEIVESVVCHPETSVVQLVFDSQDASADTYAAWSSLNSQFILVTLHAGCNPAEERGAWMVSAVDEDSLHSISLEAHSIPLREIGSSLHVSHVSGSVSTSFISQSTLQRRFGIDQIYPFNETIPFVPRQQLIPIDTTQFSTTANALLPDPAGLQVFCVNCVSMMDFSVGLELDVGLDELKPVVNEAWVNVTVNDFKHDISLEISMDAAHSWTDVFDVLMLPIDDLGVNVPVLGPLGFFWGGSIRTNITVESPLNFTVGASADIPTGATATFNATDITESSATGWDGASFDVHPFRLNSGSFSITAGVSLSPFIAATIGNSPAPSVRLYLNTPYLSGTAAVALDVNRECQPLGPDDFESFASALTLGAGIDISLEGTTSGSHLPDDDKTFFSKGFPFGNLPTLDKPKCMVFVGDTPADAAAANAGLAGLMPAATGTLVAASAAVPTFNIAGIEAYYSAHGSLPTNVNYSQMILATTVPADIQGAVQGAAASQSAGKHHHSSKAGAIAGGVIGGVALVILVAGGLWYLLFRRRNNKRVDPGPWDLDAKPTPGGTMTEKDVPPWPQDPIPQSDRIVVMPELGRNHPIYTHAEEYQPWTEERRQSSGQGFPHPQVVTITSATEVPAGPRPGEPLHPQRRVPEVVPHTPATAREEELEQKVSMMEAQIASMSAALAESQSSRS
ncbi:hypothetical protein FB45DRAFT_481771 [Roridomyces roridus]|uniref:DUF7029 domain-containing protein n=1 Tax=Roridomyces roridus TaxID=1738132 RepID=A0AAD7BZX7_9AGAR|nr:hypothetical protein FB45DRAFT_481771 [Roridomyces roridus]